MIRLGEHEVLEIKRRRGQDHGTAVLLVLEGHSPAPQFAPLLSALDRAGAQRVLRSAWVLTDSSTRQPRRQ
jgi:hypothetical protein